MARTFSQQLQVKNQQNSQGRISRTERRKLFEQNLKEKQKFEALKQEAETIRETVFVDKDGKAFTYEDYVREYSKLSPDLRQFFITPNELKQRQDIEIQNQKNIFSSKITELQDRINQKNEQKKEYEEYYNRQSSDYKEKNRLRFEEKIEEYDTQIQEYQDIILYAGEQKSKIDSGATSLEIFSYAKDKAEHYKNLSKAKSQAKEQFKTDSSSGKLDENLSKLNLSKEASYSDYIKAIADYNKTTEYNAGLIAWSAKVGYSNLPEFAKEKLNPSAIEFQKKYPQEVLRFDKLGNVIGVQSEELKMSVSIKDYQDIMLNLSNQQRLQQERRDQLSIEASNILKERGFAEGVSLELSEQSLLSKAFSGVKAGLLASNIFGFSYKLSEKQQKELTALREQRTRESIKPELNILSPFPLQLPLYKLGTLPLKKSYETVQKQRDYDYESKVGGHLFNELDLIKSSVSDELKPYIEQEGIKILREKGIEMEDETKVVSKYVPFNEKKSFDLSTLETETMTVTRVTDPAFDRKISQNMLEFESELKREGTLDSGIFRQLAPTSFRKSLLTLRIASSTALKTYTTWKTGQFVFSKTIGAVKYTKDALGSGLYLESARQTGTFSGTGIVSVAGRNYNLIKLSEGYAKVPKSYNLLKISLAGTVTGLYTYGKVRQYQSYTSTSQAGKSVFLLETAGELAGIELATGVGNKAYDYTKNQIKNIRLKTVNQADISSKGFYRTTKLTPSGREKVYMERYEGFKLSKPSTYYQKAKGLLTGKDYKAGSFTGRTYKFVPDEVLAYYKYGGDVEIYNKAGRQINLFTSKSTRIGTLQEVKLKPFAKDVPQIQKVLKSKAFPMTKGKESVKWFMERNIEEFGIPLKSKLPINLKDYNKAFGYSATPKAWTGTEYEPNKLLYYEKGVLKELKLKGAIQFVSGKGVSVGFLKVFQRGAYSSASGKTATDPVIYANYFNKVKINDAIKEIKGIDSSGRELKVYLFKESTGSAGTLNIERFTKPEVEGTVEISRRIPIRRRFAIRLAGWKIPIEEQILNPKKDLSKDVLKKIIREMGSVEETQGIAYSRLPSTQVDFYKTPIYSPITFSRLGKSRQVSSRVSSSRVSDIQSQIRSLLNSEISLVSTSSRKGSSGAGGSSITSSTSESSYDPFRYSPRKYDYWGGGSYDEILESSKPYYSSIPTITTDKIRKQIISNKKKIIEIKALFPDFTARALGLPPKKVKNINEALKEIEKIQTGFNVRTGAYIDENKLMKGLMK